MIAIITLLVFLLMLVIFTPTSAFYRNSRYVNLIKELYDVREEKKGKQNLYHLRIKPFFRKLIKYLPIDKNLPKYKTIEKNLHTANMHLTTTLDDYLALKLAAATGLGLYFLWMYSLTGAGYMLFLLVVMPYLGYLLPDSLLAIKVRKRREEIERELPALLNGLAVVCDAGLNLLPAIEEVTRHNKSVLAEELRDTLEQIYLGTPNGEAFERLANKCGVTDLSYFISALLQSMEKGSSGITYLLESQAHELWLKRKQKAEAMGQKASIKLFLPLVLLVFPAMTIFMLAPAVISTVKFFLGN